MNNHVSNDLEEIDEGDIDDNDSDNGDGSSDESGKEYPVILEDRWKWFDNYAF